MPEIHDQHVIWVADVGSTKSSMKVVVKLVRRDVAASKMLRTQDTGLKFGIPEKSAWLWKARRLTLLLAQNRWLLVFTSLIVMRSLLGSAFTFASWAAHLRTSQIGIGLRTYATVAKKAAWSVIVSLCNYYSDKKLWIPKSGYVVVCAT